MRRRAAWILGAALLVSVSCSASDADGSPAELAATTVVATTTPPTTSTTTVALLAAPTPEPEDIGNRCVVTVLAGDFLARIAGRTDDASIEGIVAENRLADGHVLHPGDLLDVCIDNDVDDITGASLVASDAAVVSRQQTKLNELFAPYRFLDLVIDGDSGPLTRQLLCAARLGLGLTVTGAHMADGSAEEGTLFAADSLSLPDGVDTSAEKWILIDKTCQVMFTGEGDQLVNIYPTSTGESGHATTNVNSVKAFRFNPALETDGWHDSTSFPVAADNPLNGNMYKPIYFNDDEAIHGAGYVPPTPRSKGCARTFPLHQDELIAWLGLADVTEAIWQTATIGLRVTVQGEYRDID
ncbi:L,D-transpeptidase [Ilumatobacter sp.]|uniref:L,D-transpeptidase n=1 Tax=Ilumatobacter sp. TaxID=1967498 RepID=UPI0037510256